MYKHKYNQWMYCLDKKMDYKRLPWWCWSVIGHDYDMPVIKKMHRSRWWFRHPAGKVLVVPAVCRKGLGGSGSLPERSWWFRQPAGKVSGGSGSLPERSWWFRQPAGEVLVVPALCLQKFERFVHWMNSIVESCQAWLLFISNHWLVGLWMCSLL